MQPPYENQRNTYYMLTHLTLYQIKTYSIMVVSTNLFTMINDEFTKNIYIKRIIN